MLPTDMSVQFISADKLKAACSAPMILFLVVNPSCVLLKGVFYLEPLFTQWTLQQLRKLFMEQFDVSPQNKLFFKSQVTLVTRKLYVMHLNVALQSFFAAEDLWALLTLNFPHLGLFSHVSFESHVGETLLSTFGTCDALSIVLVHVDICIFTAELTIAV